jgi:hydrogenase maturation protein HypF
VARVAREVRIDGSVQGIGLRPWLVCTARRLGLAGSARNAGSGAVLELEGEEAAIQACLAELRACFASRIERIALRSGEVRGRVSMAIEPSEPLVCGPALPRLPADLPVCDACLDELLDPRSRRHRYPFTHCAVCGPRASVLRAVPYDRERTSLQPFAACGECRREYADRDDRRFHAQTIACAACGPVVTAHAPAAPGERRSGEAAVEWAAQLLQGGGIVAVKGYGGFHLLCDATRDASVQELRRRKRRPTRPFAVLLPSLEIAERCVHLDSEAREWLAGARRAVVIARRRRDVAEAARLAPSLAPRSRDLGVILPCAPLHFLLLFAAGTRPPRDPARFAALVFTSANASGEPVVHANDAARSRLAPIADLIVEHDREVARPSEDSVVRTIGRTVVPLRLSRAAAPLVLALPRELGPVPPILALGGDLKCAPALAVGQEILLAEHVGDLTSADALDALEARVSDLCRISGVQPAAIACDRHPGYVSAALARRLSRRVIAVQHHHAHALAALLDDGPDHAMRPALALVLDGAGWGTDGTIWGGELLHVDPWRCERIAHLEAVALPGGDAAVREPWRMAAVWLRRAFPEGMPAALPWLRRQDRTLLDPVLAIAERGLHSPPTSSCGRLFEAVASLLDLGDRSQHEGELPMALEALASATRSSGDAQDAIPDHIAVSATPMILPAADLVRAAVQSRLSGEPRARIALRFHRDLATRLAGAVVRAAGLTGVRRVALAGGCLQNRLLCELLLARLRAAGLDPCMPRRIPPNDGGLAVGQVLAAAAVCASGSSATG